MCVVWQIVGDMDWYGKTLGLEGASDMFICPWCKANNVEALDDWAIAWAVQPSPWNDLSLGAAWRGTVWSSAQAWLREHGGLEQLHPLFLLPAVTIFTVCADVLHIVDLGVTHHLLGNLLFELVYIGRPSLGGDNPGERLDRLWMRIVAQYRHRRTPTQLSNLTRSMLCHEKAPWSYYPLLTNRVKAAESRHLVPALLDIWRDVRVPALVAYQKILTCLESLDRFCQILASTEYALPLGQQTDRMRSIDTFLLNYRWLKAQVGAAFRWHEVPKLHYCIHIGIQTHFGNPRWSWTYPDEDCMGVCKDVCEACTSGTPLTRLS